MTIDFDVQATTDAVIKAIRTQAKGGWSTIQSLVETQGKMLSQQAGWIAEGVVKGALKDDPEFQHKWLGYLAEDVKSLAHDVAALTILTVEKVWNAVVKVLWDAIDKALTGAGLGALPLPKL